MSLKIQKPRAKLADAPPPSMDTLSREFTGRPSRTAMKDAEDTARAALDPRVNAIAPPLPLDQAQLLDHVVRTHEAQTGGLKQGVDLAASEIMATMGVDRDTATVMRTALVGRGHLVQVRETAMDGGGTVFRPGPLPAAPAAD